MRNKSFRILSFSSCSVSKTGVSNLVIESGSSVVPLPSFWYVKRKSHKEKSSLVAQKVKIHLWCWRPGFSLWMGKIPWRRKWHPTPIFLSGESHGQRSLADYSPLGLQRVKHDWATDTLIFSISTPLMHPRIDASEVWCWEDSWESLGLQEDQTSQS